MAPNQYGDDEVAMILALETRQRQDAAAKDALGDTSDSEATKQPEAKAPRPSHQRDRRPPDRA